jgi:hypothetical protein
VGGVVSPILANIYLHELDEFMAEMRAGFDRGLKRRANPAYAALTRRIHKLRREIDALRAAGAGEALIRPLRDEIRERQRERRSVPAVDPMDPGFRRLRYCRYADDVRHITRRWIPFAERRGLEDMTLGPTAYPAAKVKGDRSMPSKRERSEDADDPVPQGPRDTVRTELFEPQPPTMQAYIPRHSVLRRGHRDRATKSSSLEPSTRWAMGHRPIQGGERGTSVALDTSSTTGMWDRPTRREAQGDGAAVVLRGRESRPHGEGR